MELNMETQKTQTTRQIIEILIRKFPAKDREDFREIVLEAVPRLSADKVVSLGITDTSALNSAISAIFWWEF